MGEYSQPVVGMKSSFEAAKEEWHEANWRAREWFVVNKAEIQMSADKVLIPHVQMGVEAREQIKSENGLEDSVITRPDHPLVKYAEAFTHNFDLIAERKSSVYHLRELAKASTLAKYLLDAQINLEDSWLNLTQEVKGLYYDEIPQLWNQRTSSQVKLQDGKILDAEKGMGMATRGVYGGVQFGLDKFDLGATTMQPGAAEAPYALLFSGVDRGSVMARGVVTPPSLVEPRGVDLNLDKFNLAETKASEDVVLADAVFGNAFWSQIQSDNTSVFPEQDKSFFMDLFNPQLSDRRDEGDRFVPPNMRPSYIAELRSLLQEEKELQQQRKAEFFSKDLVVGNAGACFP